MCARVYAHVLLFLDEIRHFRDSLKDMRFYANGVDPREFLMSKVPALKRAIAQFQHDMKIWLCLKIEFEKALTDDTISGHFCCKQKIVLPGTNIDQVLQEAFAEIDAHIEEFVRMGSGWVISRLIHLDYHLARYRPLRGSSYVPLPPFLVNKKAVVNVQNNDQKCFLWSILAALHPTPHHPYRVVNYRPYENELVIDRFPVTLPDITKIEEDNDVSINVYGFPIAPLRVTTRIRPRHVNLLLYEGHYSLIKNLDRLLADQRRHDGKKYFCPRCFMPQYTQQRLADHDCDDTGRIKMPDEDELQFKNAHRLLRVPYMVSLWEV